MNKPIDSKLKLPNARVFGTIGVVGLFLVLIGYVISNEILTVSGWVLIIVGGGCFLILMRTRIYRMH